MYLTLDIIEFMDIKRLRISAGSDPDDVVWGE